MKLSKITLAVLAASSFAGAAHAAPAVTGSAALTSDYLFRGISQSAENMAVQGSFTATDDSGIYFTAWGSSISTEATGRSASSGLELDTLLGYTTTVGDITYDIGVMRYNYPGADKVKPRISYNEVYGSVAYKGAKLGTAFSDDYFGETGKFNYVYVDYTTALTERVGAVAHVGYNAFESAAFLLGNSKHYVDYKVGLNSQVAGLGIEVAYIGSDANAKKSVVYGENATGRAVFTVSKAF